MPFFIPKKPTKTQRNPLKPKETQKNPMGYDSDNVIDNDNDNENE